MSSTNASGTLPHAWWTDWLNEPDVHERIARGVSAGLSDQQVAVRVGVASKTVQRYRARNKIPANVVNQNGARRVVERTKGKI